MIVLVWARTANSDDDDGVRDSPLVQAAAARLIAGEGDTRDRLRDIDCIRSSASTSAESEQAIRIALHDPTSFVRLAATHAAIESPRSSTFEPDLSALFPSADAGIAQVVGRHWIETTPDTELAQTCEKLWKSGRVELAIEVLQTLTFLQTPAARALVERYVEAGTRSRHSTVVVAAIRLAAGARTTRCVAALRALAASESSAVALRVRALDALVDAAPRGDALMAFVHATRSEEPEVVRAGLSGLRDIQATPEEWEPALREVIVRGSDWRRLEAELFLSRVGEYTGAVVEDVVSLALAGGPEDLLSCVGLLVVLDPRRRFSWPAIERAARSDDPGLQLSAVMSLKSGSPSDARRRDLLTHLSRSDDEEVRVAALKALGQPAESESSK